MHRRHFLQLLTLPGVAFAARSRGATGGASLRIGLVAAADGVSPRTAAFRTGAMVGASEARHAAAMFGGDVSLVHGTAEELLAAGVSALLGGASDDECARVGALAARAGIPFLNLGATADALRDGCLATTFHVAASEAMARAARAQAGAPAGAPVLLWHPTLERFGAEQLNARVRAATGQEMTEDTWAAWVAVKIVAEGALRVRDASPAALAAWIARPGNRLDGHKGAPLAFEAGSRQLRQPLYVLHEDRPREVPARAHRAGDAAASPACPTEPR